MNKSILALLVALALAGQAAAHSNPKPKIVKFQATALPGLQFPTPILGSKTKATLKFTLSGTTLSGTLEVDNIVNFNQAHLHVGNSTTNGPVAFWVWPTDTNAITGQPLTGSFSLPWQVNSTQLVAGAGVDFNTFLGLLLTEGIYLNLHTVTFPNGVARGQVVPGK